MKYTAKRGFSKYIVYDKNGSTVSTVRMERAEDCRLYVKNAENNCCYRLLHRDGMLELTDLNDRQVFSGLIYESGGTGRRSEEAYTRPPMAEKAEIVTDHGRITVRQTRKRDFRIYLNEKEAGKMTHMMHFSKLLTLSENFPAEYAGLVFAVGMLMLHADDVEIV